jgi:hypothetical protein
VRRLSSDPRHKHACRTQRTWPEEGNQASSSPESHPRSRCRREQLGTSCCAQWFSVCHNTYNALGYDFFFFTCSLLFSLWKLRGKCFLF